MVDADVQAFFDEIDHDVLLRLVERRVIDHQILKVLRSRLHAGVMEEGQLRSTIAGTPQGGVISPLLANIVLHELDRPRSCHQADRLAHWRRKAGQWGIAMQPTVKPLTMAEIDVACQKVLRNARALTSMPLTIERCADRIPPPTRSP